MASYYIVGHIKRCTPEIFMAVVNAIPASAEAGATPQAADEIGETATSFLQARMALHRLSIVMGARIRAQGGTISGVEI